MKLKDIHFILGKLRCTPDKLTLREVSIIVDHIVSLEALLDEADEDDTFGTEGWKHRLGVDD